MKKNQLIYLLPLCVLVFFVACKKDKSGEDNEIETTFQLSENQAQGESIADDVNTIFIETTVSEGLMTARGNGANETTGTLSCASVSVTPANSFPKTIVVDFGNGCTSFDQIERSGIITIVLSDSAHHNGATATMTFTNYKVEGYKVEGTVTWTNTSTPNGISWTRAIADGKITVPSGNYYWLHTGSKTVVQTGGMATPTIVFDDVYSVTGNHTVTNPAGKSRTATIMEALVKKVICHNVTKGTIKIQGPNHYAMLDYGDGSCDNVATVSIDGNTPRIVILP